MQTLLLPGMDGTGRLFVPLTRHLAPTLHPRIVSFPAERRRSYDELLHDIALPNEPFAIVAESFSGPLGIRLAHRHADRCRALVLVATFVTNPSALAASMRALIGPRIFRAPPPGPFLRWALLGMDASHEQLNDLRAALSCVAPEVLADRVRQILAVDVTKEFASSPVPTLYIAGSRDRLVGAKVMARMNALRPDMRTHVLDAPHLVLQRKPAEAAKLIWGFVSHLPS